MQLREETIIAKATTLFNNQPEDYVETTPPPEPVSFIEEEVVSEIAGNPLDMLYHQIVARMGIKREKDIDDLLFENMDKFGMAVYRTGQNKALSYNIERAKKNLRAYETDLRQNNIKLGIFRQALLDFGLTEDDIAFIPQDLAEKDFRDEQGERRESDYFIKEAKRLDDAIIDFMTKHKDIDDTTAQLYDAQNGIVESQEKRLKANEELRVEVEEETQNCLYALTRHIQQAINEYIEEFNVLADLLRAEGKGRLDAPTDDPAFWELHMFIGFDGKKPAPINGPDLSQGQRACTSLMLLLAAISNRKNGGLMPIMFLDEPRSRLDDDRGNEVGNLLQVTDVQYFITHQQGESLKTVNWINHAYTCIKCDEDELFAPPMILKRMRAE